MCFSSKGLWKYFTYCERMFFILNYFKININISAERKYEIILYEKNCFLKCYSHF